MSTFYKKIQKPGACGGLHSGGDEMAMTPWWPEAGEAGSRAPGPIVLIPPRGKCPQALRPSCRQPQALRQGDQKVSNTLWFQLQAVISLLAGTEPGQRG